MGSYGASSERNGVHLNGYVFTGIITGMDRIFSFMPLSCASQLYASQLLHLKKGLTKTYQHPV